MWPQVCSGSSRSCIFQTFIFPMFLMIIAEGHLVIIGTTRRVQPNTVTESLRPVLTYSFLPANGSAAHATWDTRCQGVVEGTASQTLPCTKRGSQGLASLRVHAGVGRSTGPGRGRRPHWRRCFLSSWAQHLLEMVPRPLFRPLP